MISRSAAWRYGQMSAWLARTPRPHRKRGFDRFRPVDAARIPVALVARSVVQLDDDVDRKAGELPNQI